MIKVVDGIAYTTLTDDQDPVTEGIRIGPPPFESVDWAEFLYQSAERHGALTMDDALRGDKLARVMRDLKLKLTALYKGDVV